MNLVLKLLEEEKENCYRDICLLNKRLNIKGLSRSFYKSQKVKRNKKSKYYCQLIATIIILNNENKVLNSKV